jgi:transcriptional regulator with XRE-family HTH domain
MTCDTERMTSDGGDHLSRRARAGQWLREQRQSRGFSTAAEFGRALGISKELVSNYETGRSSVPDDKAERIAEVLDMDIIEARRNLGLWVPPQASDELAEPEDDPELIQLIRRARRERDGGDDTLYKMLLRLQGMSAPQRDSDTRDDRRSDGNRQAS